MSFDIDLDRFKKNNRLNAEQSIRKIAIKAYSDITLATPVDLGTARANWNVSGGSVDLGTTERTDHNTRQAEELAKVKGFSEKAVTHGDDINISNNLPYIRPLEYGWSKQAPNGMVRVTAQRLANL